MFGFYTPFSEITSDPAAFVKRAEASYRERIVSLISSIPATTRFIALAGPSCSGKTTTAHRLTNAFETMGMRVFALSLDDFFHGVENAPLDEEGKPDLDHIDLIDRPLLQQVIEGFDKNETVEIPTFSFVKRRRDDVWRTVDSSEYDVCIIEGLHALHPHFNALIPKDHLFSVFAAVTDPYLVDDVPYFEILEIRLLRRMVRDYYNRAASVEYTHQLWKNVLRGENRFIYPYVNRADAVISSNMATEPFLMRHDATPLLNAITPDMQVYPIACTLKDKLNRLPALSPTLLPADSLMREFVGHI